MSLRARDGVLWVGGEVKRVRSLLVVLLAASLRGAAGARSREAVRRTRCAPAQASNPRWRR